MSKIMYLGDTHGNAKFLISAFEQAEKLEVSAIVQVGDFGFKWPGGPCQMLKYLIKRNKRVRNGRSPRIPLYTCLGNHDVWPFYYKLQKKQAEESPEAALIARKRVLIAPNTWFIPRGQECEISGVMHVFCGGARSTDKHVRTEGKNWWSQEEPTYEELSMTMNSLEEHKPITMITHEAPLSVSIERSGRRTDLTARGLDNIFKLAEYRPRYWFYGHHHQLVTEEIDATTFVNCGLSGQFALMDYETDTLTLH